MPAIDYLEIRDGAAESIIEAGQLGKLLRNVGGTGGDWWNPSTETGVTLAEYDAQFVVIDYDQENVDGVLVEQSDKQVLMAAPVLDADGNEVTPLDSDRLQEADGTIWEIVKVKPLKPAGISVIYDIQVRI
jgi:hypothetical protein